MTKEELRQIQLETTDNNLNGLYVRDLENIIEDFKETYTYKEVLKMIFRTYALANVRAKS